MPPLSSTSPAGATSITVIDSGGNDAINAWYSGSMKPVSRSMTKSLTSKSSRGSCSTSGTVIFDTLCPPKNAHTTPTTMRRGRGGAPAGASNSSGR